MNAPHDQNFIKGKLGVLFSDGVTLIPIAIDPTTKGMKVNLVDTVPAPVMALFADNIMPRDENWQHVWFGVDRNDDTHVLPIFVDADGAVLVDVI